MKLTDSGSACFQLCPAGSYLARCCQLVDLGTQTTTFEGETKQQRKVLLAWELLDNETRRDDGAPFVLAKRYTQSLHEKAALRKELASWRGRDFTPEELRGFDPVNVLGHLAFLSVIHVTKADKTFANIASIMRPPKGLASQVEPTEPLIHFDLSAPDWQAFASLSSRLQDQIAASPEYQALPNRPTAVAVSPTPAATATPAPSSGFDDLDDDIPF